MPIPSPEQQLEIARRVHATLDRPARWHQRGWGRDDHGHAFEFDGGSFHAVDDDKNRHAPALRPASPDSRCCFCLGGAIRIHTGAVMGHDPSHTGDATETVCAAYTRAAGIDLEEESKKWLATEREPHLTALISWNDASDRSHADVRELTGAVLRHVDAPRRPAPAADTA